MRTTNQCERPAERGTALILSLLALLCLTLVGGLFVANTKTETQIAGHDMRYNQALYNAEAGCAEVLTRMSNLRSDSTNYIGQVSQTGWVSQPGWGRYIVLANGGAAQDPTYTETETDGLDNDGDANIDEADEVYPEVITVQNGSTVNYPWVKVHYKRNGANQVVLFGDHDHNPSTAPIQNLTQGFPVILATSEGMQGSAMRRIEIEAVKRPYQTVAAATYSEDDTFAFNGTQFLVSGRDWDPDTGLPLVGGTEVNGIVTTQNPSNIINALSGQQTNNVEGVGPEPSVQPSPVNLDLQALADEFGGMADVTMGASTVTGPSWGNANDYRVVHCTGDLHVSGGGQGGGVLVVDGDFECTGQFTWYGLVIVLGDMRFSGGGAGVHIYGSTLVQGGIANQTVSGNADLLYSSIALNRLAYFARYQTVSWHEL
ncbi:MAG TPA: hypothetical protein VNM87_05965 [Candidatus Udaeobacter sp.]|nr:hypothetical protein [Candidatus Udaeobacter sp.]